MKRRCVDDTDNDDDFMDDDDYSNTIGSPSQSCQGPDRKRRRGIIEKRRRDRINHSLTELRRLVPAAFEKQGATKLEKAEILKMTVDHLKMLQSKGSNGPGVDTTSLAMDFRSVGFRECTAEVARYLVAIEGLDSQDPLRVRLISHLQYYSLHARSTSTSSLPPTPTLNTSTGCWSHVTQNVVPPPYAVTPMSSLMTSYPTTQGGLRQMEQPITGGTSSSFVEGERFTVDARFSARFGSSSNDDRMMTSGYGTLSAGTRRFQPNSVGASFSSDASQMPTQPILSGLNGHFMQGGGNYPSAISSMDNNIYSNLSSASSSTSASSMLLQCVKPYRPWGSESLMASLMSTY